ncbi:choline/Carnitine O-acyltransferase, partial [Thraustotheca clavata]
MVQTTFALQKNLPRLPVPELEQTARKYLDSIKPFVTKEEYEKTKQLMADFVGPNGQAYELQKVLIERTKTEKNWLEEWWEYAGYTSYRAPTAIDINMISGFGSFSELDQPVPPCRRAAEIIRYGCEYHAMLTLEKVPPEEMGRRPMCMNMFRRVFSACRIPSMPADTYERLDGSKQIDHVVVFCKGYAFSLTVVDNKRQLLSIGDLERQLQFIHRYAHSLPPAFAVGALTSAHRDTWTEAREAMLPLGSNAKSFQMIQESLFAVCLDESTPRNSSECLKQISAGTCSNRWYDKSLQFIVFANGNVGCNMEHGNADATVYRSVFEWLGRRYLTRNGSLETKIESTSDQFLPPPTLLEFQVPDEIATMIASSITLFNKKAARFQACVIRHKEYGRLRIKNDLQVAPDTFVQMAMQHAAYKIWKKVVPTYESAHTRWFVHGRTETIRSCSPQVLKWLSHLEKDEAGSYQHFQAAMDKHQQLAMEALDGQGTDRHLLGLQIASVLQNQPLHPLFTDPSYVKSGGNGNFILSTSNVSGYDWCWGGFAPMVDYGIGVCYSISNNFVGYTVTSMKKDA